MGAVIFARIAGDEGPSRRERILFSRGSPPVLPRRRHLRRARRRVDVRRRHPRPAAAVAAPAGDGGGRPALRLPRRPVGTPPAHQHLPGRDDVRHDRGRRPRGPHRAGRPQPHHRHRTRTGVRTPRPTRTCCAGCTWPRSTASSAPTTATAPSRWMPRGRDEYVAQTAVVARALGATDVPETVAELDEVMADYRPELASTPRPGRRRASSSCTRRCRSRCDCPTRCSRPPASG